MRQHWPTLVRQSFLCSSQDGMPERLSDCYLRRGLEPLDGVVLGVVPRDGIEPPTRGFSIASPLKNSFISISYIQ